MTIIGFSCYFHDAAACIMVDGKIVAAAAEERFSRIKHDNSFPKLALQYCLSEAGLAMSEIDVVVFYEKPLWKFERMLHQHLQTFPQSFGLYCQTANAWFTTKLNIKQTLREELHFTGTCLFIPHHLSHAASAYYLSGFKQADIVTIDGVGEWTTTAIHKGLDTSIKTAQEIVFPHSLGLLYSAVTTYLGFSANDAEYKVMGLAAYGNPAPFRDKASRLLSLHKDGSFSLDMQYFSFEHSEQMFSGKFSALFGAPPRLPESEMSSMYENIAASLQEVLEKAVFHMLNSVQKKTKSTLLCLAGGVALNSVLNGKILKKTKYKQLFIPPDPSDAGGAMGAALWAYFNFSLKGETLPSFKEVQRLATEFAPYLGPQYSWYEVVRTIKQYKLKYKHVSSTSALVKKVATAIANQKVIGWFQGRMEWGPRALGSRSILASAATAEMKDIINARVKHRELFRPFAPAILEEHVESYFEADKNIPRSARWMLMVYPFKSAKKKKLPAVVHVDGTGRLQIVSKKENPLYYAVIDEYYKKTGTAAIINTSFNVRGEPIVCTPKDAIECFLHTDIDMLVMDQFVITKE